MKPLKIKKQKRAHREGYNEWMKYIYSVVKKIKNDKKKKER